MPGEVGLQPVAGPHLSGTMLYLIGRIERYYTHMRGPAFFSCRKMPSWYMKRMYHDSVCFQHSALELAAPWSATATSSSHLISSGSAARVCATVWR